LEQLKKIESETVQTVVTSPPYWGLRDYGTASWKGGRDDCDHISGLDKPRSGRPLGKFHGGDDKFHTTPFKDKCGKCGAVRIDNQIGLEKTPEEYIERMTAVFREVKRVLKGDGTIWVNMGDGFNEKQLTGMPWRLAFALQSDGWYLRSDIIWSKPNPMPESVTDRPTKAHEYIFLLSKSPRYYYNADAIRDKCEYGRREWSNIDGNMAGIGFNGDRGHATVAGKSENPMRNKRSVWEITTQPYPEAHFATFPEKIPELCIRAGTKLKDTVLDPFMGSGTTCAVAKKLGRQWIGIELNPEYIKLAERRIERSVHEPELFEELA